ncbi:Na+/H+ antiporter subunit G [Candidatus Tisiphia endosymbiont of Nemotelus uliginosus]|uniref:Na+/H+ antiporter subunit G n=1 Tax=Candidatus Tisiphia endosymbiont of Nemotelus uliginosus TaxID=3077926 RepID=UPI0035C8BA9A
MMLFIGYIFIFLGISAIFSGIIGLVRFVDFYTKIHAASLIECCGVPLTLIGLAFLQQDSSSTYKLIFAVILILILNPVSTYAIGKASLLSSTQSHSKANIQSE